MPKLWLHHFKNQRAAQIFVTKPAKESTNILA
jgi:hypothetical protein